MAYLAIVWAVVFFVLLLAELHTQAFFGIFGAVAAAAAFLAALLGAGALLQLIVFIAVAGVGLGVVRRLLLPYLSSSRIHRSQLKSGVAGLVGEVGVVEVEVKDEALPGRVRVRGDSWLAVTWDGEPLEPNTKVRVLAVEDGKLVVSREVERRKT